MPQVRRAEREIETAPIPGVRKQAAKTAISEGAGIESARSNVGEAIAGFGGAVARIGARTYGEIVEESRQRADSVALLAGQRRLGEWENRTLWDEKTGAMITRRGKDAMGLPEELRAAFDKEAGEIEKGMNDRQRARFAQIKVSRGLGLDLQVQRHVAGEITKYEAEELEGTLTLAKSEAAVNALEPEKVGPVIAGGVAAIREHAPNMMSPKQVDAMVLKFTTEAHSDVIDRLILNDQDLQAKAYLDEVKQTGEISGAAIARIESKVHAATTEANGERAASTIWEKFKPADDLAPISLDKMEEAAREKWGDNTDSLKATISALRSRKEGVDSGRRAREENINSTVWGAVVQGQSYQQVRRTPEFRNLPGDQQIRVRDYFDNAAAREESRAAARDSRELAADARRERKLELEGWSSYLDFKADPEKLRATTPGEILKKLPELGQAHVNRLLEDREKLIKDESTFRAAVIDRDLFNEVMNEAGVPGVYTAPGQRTKSQKADLGKLLSTIEEAIGRKQVAAGRRLTREETEAIARETVDSKVLVKDGWFSNDERYPALLSIADVPATEQTRIREYLAARGLTSPTERDIVDTYAGALPKVKK